MEYCDRCGNILLPKKATGTLLCRICNTEIPMSESNRAQYKSCVHKKRKKDAQKYKTAIVTAADHHHDILPEDREAYEDIFKGSGDHEWSGDTG